MENGELLSGCGFVQNIAPLLLFRDRRIKTKQNKKTRSCFEIKRDGLTTIFGFITVLSNAKECSMVYCISIN